MFPAARTRRHSFRPRLEILEHRLAPATHTWTGTAGNLWSNAGNWTGGVPVAGEANLILNFSGVLNLINQNDIPNLTVEKISFPVAGNNYQISGQQITLTGSIESANIVTSNNLQLPIKLSGNILVTDNGAGSPPLILSGVLSGTGGLVFGAGNAQLSGSAANTYTGATRVNASNLSLMKSTGPAVSGALIIGDGIGAASADTVTLALANQIADTGAVTVNSSGRLDLNGLAETIGPLKLNGGNVVTGAGTLSLNGSVAAAASASTSSITGLLSLGSATRTFTVAAGQELDIAAVVSGTGTGNLMKSGTGKLVLSAANTFQGTVTVNGGILAVQNNNALGSTAEGTFVKKGATLLLEDLGGATDADIVNEPLILTGRGFGGRGALDSFEATVSSSNSWTGPITLKVVKGEPNVAVGVETEDLILVGNLSSNGAAGLIKVGSGNLRLGNGTDAIANTYGGSTRVNAGTLTLAKTAGTTAVPHSLIVGDGVGTDLVKSANSNQIADTAAVTVNPLATWDLLGFSESIGAMTLKAGTVQTGAGTLTLLGNVTVNSATAPSSLSGKISLAGATRTFTVNKNANLVVSGLDGLAASVFVKAGPGGLSLPTANATFAGVARVTGGTLTIQNTQSLGTTGAAAPTEVSAGGTLQVTGGITVNETLILFGGSILQSDANSNTWTGPITLTAAPKKPAAVVKVDAGGVLQLNTNIGGTGGLTKSSPGNLTLAGTNSYTGVTTMNEGSLTLNGTTTIAGNLVAGDGIGADVITWGAPNQIANTATILVKSSGKLDLGGFTDTVHILTVLDGGQVFNGTLTAV